MAFKFHAKYTPPSPASIELDLEIGKKKGPRKKKHSK